MTLPREGPLGGQDRDAPPPRAPARTQREVKRVEGEDTVEHGLGTHSGHPSDIGAASLGHGHAVTLDVLLPPKIVDGDGATLVPVGNWPVTLTGDTDTVHFVWQVPTTWVGFNSISVVMIPDNAEEIQMDIDVSVSATGEQHDADDRQSLNETKTIAGGDVDDLVEWDILDIGPLFLDIGVGDFITVKLTSDIDGLVIVGLRINYDAGGWSGGSGGGGGDSHNPVTLDADAGAFFSLTVQELGLDAQAANSVAAGPAAGGADVPTFRALVAADVPAHDYDIHDGGVPFAELEYDDGTSDPLIDGVADDGVEDSAARKDHVHPKHHTELHEPESHLSTDITGAELETLSDTSDADALHDHATHTLKDGTRAFTGVVAGVTPVAGVDLATKDYVDQSVNFISEYYLNDTGSDIGGYFKMLDTPTGEGESDFATGGLGAGADQLLDVWATDEDVPGVTVLEAGVYSAHIHVERTGGNRPYLLYFEIYSRTHPGGAETLRATSELSEEINDNNKTGVELHATLADEVVIATTDRIAIKWYANLGVGAATELTLYAEGDNNSRVSLPISTEVLNQVYIRQDGTKAFTGEQSMGTNKLTNVVDPGANQDAATKKYVDDNLHDELHAGLHADGAPDELAVQDLASDAATDGQKLVAKGDGAVEFETDYETINFVINGGGEVISTGFQPGVLEIPCKAELVECRLLAGEEGSIKIDIWECTYAEYDPNGDDGAAHPVNGDTITGGNEPEIVATYKYTDATLTDWTKSLTPEQILAFNVDSVATLTWCVVVLKLKRLLDT